MATLVVPPLDREPWPTLGPQVCDWIEAHAVYGPGDLEGQPYRITDEFRAQLYRAYEVHPAGSRLAGRRRFKTVALEERKGTAKTERAMVVAFCELHPDGPVRCDGFDASGEPVGRGVVRPYVPLVSYTEEQTDDLAYAVLRYIIGASDLADDFDVGLERIIVLGAGGREAGKAVALAGSPNARDGALTTFQHFDEPHRMTSRRLKQAYSTMVENTFKRVGADAWTLCTSTAGEPGAGSVQEDLHQTADAIARGEVDNPSLFFFARSAPDDAPLDTPAEVRAALLEASGPAAKWSGDIDGLVTRFFEPRTDREYYRRVWLNQWVSGGSRAFDAARWGELADPGRVVADGALVTLGFDGARKHDATGLVLTEVESGHQIELGVWERPLHADDGWEVPAVEVDAVVAAAFDRWDVWRMYADPPYWDDWISTWAGRYGEKRVVAWWTNRNVPMGHALRRYRQAIDDGLLSHDGSSAMARHVANAYRKLLPQRSEDDEPLFVIRKARADSPDKIDLAMAGALSWEARADAITAGAASRRTVDRTLRTF